MGFVLTEANFSEPWTSARSWP